MPKETMELAVINTQNAVQVFTCGGMKALLDEIETKVRAIPLDASTALGREQIRSTAYGIARTKTALDTEGKKLTEDWREATKKVNAERKLASERLDALAEEVRRPLTEYENRDKVRIAAHELAIRVITGLHSMVADRPDMPAKDLAVYLQDLRAALPGRDWEEFASRAKQAREQADKYITDRLERRQKYEADQAELDRLRKEEAARIARERDERMKAEAAEAARLAAERKAKAEADAEARRVIEAAEAERKRVQAEIECVRREEEEKASAIERQRQAEEQARIAAERRAKAAEEARIEFEERAARERKAAQEKAEREKQAAVQRERDRIARNLKAAEEARMKREADEANRAKVRADIVHDLACELGLLSCPDIADALIAGKIRHVTVTF